MSNWKNFAIEKMRKANLKLTPQRLKLIEVIEKTRYKHPSLNEIYDEVKKEYPTTSFSTLYSNLLILKGLNLIEFFSFERETRLEVNVKPHINVVHADTGEISDFVDEELIKNIERKMKKKVKMINVLVEG
ncbi:ferric uptake regulator, Fur family [Ferroglobus placidus DSM 10642]|uniref:Ferric uptake regulator, Fur family n=1 Tax=Ferroglobus placidus (strain DSM 10642 / AEDII12DO) TaxID=589924 RepID=D3S0P4_FERPA|nr:Fur family transcriptional regulator [Ferroglobus placidus]ADC66285.1 ferric uptake regulator, Fur family [Ferroglobus placidus DSM 10642]